MDKPISVTENRERYIGSSDFPAIMGASKYKTRFQLLQEKAGIVKSDHTSNTYTRFGDAAEPYILKLFNSTWNPEVDIFKSDEVAICEPHTDNGLNNIGVRVNMDGYNGHEVVEIKTTSRKIKNINEAKDYFWQTALSMWLTDADTGYVIILRRTPAMLDWFCDKENGEYDDDSLFEELKVSDLQIFEINRDSYKHEFDKIESALKQFDHDLGVVKANPFTAEEDLMPGDLILATNEILLLEAEINKLKVLENKVKQKKEQLKLAMEKHNIKKWEMFNGTTITRIADSEDSYSKVLDADKAEYYIKNSVPENDLDMFYKDKHTKGRKGYVRITLPS